MLCSMLISNDQKIVKIICYSFDSCEKMVATKFDSIIIYMDITDQIIMISSWRRVQIMRHIASRYSSLVL